jgi:tetratricopeptide (TPR) repeat protein
MIKKFLFFGVLLFEVSLYSAKSQDQSDSLNVMDHNSKDTILVLQATPPISVEVIKNIQPKITQQKIDQPASPIQSTYTNVKLNSPILNIDLIMDLYNRDIDFDIEYSSSSSKVISSGVKAKPSESDVAKVVTSPTNDSLKSNQGDKDNTPYTIQDANYNKAMVHLSNAQKFFSGQKYSNALIEINRSIQFAPNIALARAVKGSILYMLKQPDEAKQSWERALELDPTMENVRALLLRMY